MVTLAASSGEGCKLRLESGTFKCCLLLAYELVLRNRAFVVINILWFIFVLDMELNGL